MRGVSKKTWAKRERERVRHGQRACVRRERHGQRENEINKLSICALQGDTLKSGRTSKTIIIAKKKRRSHALSVHQIAHRLEHRLEVVLLRLAPNQQVEGRVDVGAVGGGQHLVLVDLMKGERGGDGSEKGEWGRKENKRAGKCVLRLTQNKSTIRIKH